MIIYDFHIMPLVGFRIFTEWTPPFQSVGFIILLTSFSGVAWNCHPFYEPSELAPQESEYNYESGARRGDVVAKLIFTSPP